jgi:teichuronic acid biosynthesis glycosyltransferase TuaG
VANQELIIYEHILVDDCSQDNSYTLLTESALKNPFIKVIRLPKNSGPAFARNVAIKYASGKYLAFLDADDYWMPNKLAIHVKFMEENNAVISFSDYRNFSEDSRLISKRISGFNKIGLSMHYLTRYIACSSVMVNYEKMPDFQFSTIDKKYKTEDFLAWANIIKVNGPALRCPYDLTRYAMVFNSRSSSLLEVARSVWTSLIILENISLVKAVQFFIGYIFFSIYKRLWFKPKIKSFIIDGELSKKYLLDIKK